MDRNQIFETLRKGYNDSEFKQLCFSLQIDVENLGGSTRNDKMLELIMLLERRERIPELVRILSPQVAAPAAAASPATDFLQRAKAKIRVGELEEALQIMFDHVSPGSSLERNLNQFSSRFHIYRKNAIANLLSRQESDQQHSTLSDNLLELIDQAD